MKPYFDQNGITLYLGDALDVLPTLPESSVDALITDPPYCSGAIGEAQRVRANGQGLRSETIKLFGWFVGDNMGTAGLAFLLRSIAVASRRVCRASASMLFFCDWRMLPTLSPAIESASLRYQRLIVWDKQNMGMGNGFRCQHELILHYTCGEPVFFDKGTANVIHCRRVNASERDHHTQKPVELMERLIAVVAPAGGCVLDTFAGSCSTLLAARQTGRRAIGIEHDEQWAETAARRLEQQVLTFPDHDQESTPEPSQGDLFVATEDDTASSPK